ncbi:MAG: hypothetical protein ACO3GR_06700 [Candidatus Kapaibacteriota bacterium]
MSVITNSTRILFVFVLLSIFISCSKESISDDKPENATSENPKLKSAISAGTISKEMYSEKSSIEDKNQISKELDLTALQPGTVLKFGSSEKDYTQVIATINADSTIDIVYNYRWAMNGNRDFIKERVSTGKYKVSYRDGNTVQTDNESFPLYQNVIVLVNNDYTRENGYSDIGRSFCIGKSLGKEAIASKDKNAIPTIRLYEWQDPNYYPRGNFYNFMSSKELYEIDYVK